MRRNRILHSDEYVTRDEAAAILGVNRSTMRSWIRRGLLKETNGQIRLDEATRLI
jgi:hypothetical protein